MTGELQLFDALPAHIEDALRASIQRFGVLVPVATDQHGTILDGHHRGRIADQLGVKYRVDVIQVSSDDDRREIARTLNSDRRQLSEDQRQAVAAQLRADGYSIRSIAGALGVGKSTIDRDLSTVPPGTVPDRVKGLDGKSRPSRRLSVVPAKNPREAERAQQAMLLLGDDTPGGVTDLKRIERTARDVAADRQRSAPVESVSIAGELEIRHGDLRDVLSDLSGCVDLVFTDPPYPDEYTPLWSDLGQQAAGWLKPGGFLLAYSGQLRMFEAHRMLADHLDYWWCGAITHTGAFHQVYSRRMQVGWKPVLMFRRPGGSIADAPWTRDTVTEGREDKSGHVWQQSEAEAAYWIEKLTQPGDLVVDPFLGSGTTAAACKALGRRFIGCDVDAAAVATARERVA